MARRISISHYVILIVAGCITMACGSRKGPEAADLTGEWQVVHAARDGRITHTLDGAYFNFLESGSLVTNITGVKDSATYSFHEMTVQHDGKEKAVYRVSALTEDHMTLQTALRGMEFQLDLQKVQTK